MSLMCPQDRCSCLHLPSVRLCRTSVGIASCRARPSRAQRQDFHWDKPVTQTQTHLLATRPPGGRGQSTDSRHSASASERVEGPGTMFPWLRGLSTARSVAAKDMRARPGLHARPLPRVLGGPDSGGPQGPWILWQATRRLLWGHATALPTFPGPCGGHTGLVGGEES